MPEITARLSTALAGRYTIERELGAGGMATVYLAHDVKHNRRVAVKVLKPELAAVLGSERFLKEIEVTANLQHPRILPFRGTRRAETGVGYTRVEGRRLFHAMLELPAQRAWRFRLVAFLEAVYGVRANQTVQLRWDDVNFDREYCVALPNGKTVELVGTITFRKDALGSKGQPDRAMPMLPSSRQRLLEAWNRRRDETPWVIWNWRGSSAPSTYGSMNQQLRGNLNGRRKYRISRAGRFMRFAGPLRLNSSNV